MKYLLSLLFLNILFLSSAVTLAQNTLWGTVQDKATGQRMAGVNLLVKGSVVGTVTDNKGQFSLQTNQALPLALAVSAIGYEKQEIVVSTGAQAIDIALAPQTTLMQEVVVAASRVEESSLKAPVTIEKMDVRAIRETPSFTFYDALQHVKSLDMVTSGLTYKAINTRGFAGTGNSRFLQLVDGVDNQTPGLNFAVGNLFGLSDLDAESAELIPGSASALYGPVAFNGVLVMRSKNPFQYQGLSVTGKLGVNHVNDPNTAAAPLYDVGLRYAQVLTPRLAFKINASYLRGLDWFATNYRDIDTKTPAEGRGDDNPGRNALNRYGDEVAQTLPGIGRVSRTGYEERHLSDYHVHSLKLNGALHYRLSDKVEAIYQYNYGLGTANYTGSSRFSINNFTLQQHRAELRGSQFFVRAYTTIENSHDSYNARTLGQQLNKTWVRDLDGNVVSPDKADQTWFGRYAAAYQGKAEGITPGDHTAARSFADEGRYLPGTPDFDREKNRLSALYGGATGAGIFSNSKLYHAEGQYDLSPRVKVLDLLVGGNYRMYDMFTDGTLFDDKNQRITIGEYGTFVQASKELFNKKLKLTASGRYDKNQNFRGRLTPRASAVFSPLENHNVRLSYQTGFRNPTPVDQYIKLFAGPITILGGVPGNSRGMNVYENAYTATSVGAFGAAFGAEVGAGASPQEAIARHKDKLQQARVPYIKPERVTSYEAGYKGLLGNALLVDANYYYSAYQDFILNQVVISPQSPVTAADGGINPAAAADLLGGKSQAYQLYTNAADKVSSQGASLGIGYYLPGGYLVSGNGTWADFNLRNADPNNIPAFNTPRYKTNLGLSNRNVYRNVGFSVNWHWQDAFDWVGSFADLQAGRVQAYHLFDAQVSYNMPALRSVLKVGANNLANRYVVQAYGSPAVGGIYYVSLTFDELLR
jgi:outer membrane receptor protein involved in Fe transport